MSIYVLGNFQPFYQGADTLLYGSSAINIANGNYEYTNKFLQETTYNEFVSSQFVKTTHNSVIPIGGIGMYVLATLSFLVGGYYGLFYLGPIITIILLIFTDRIATKLFGSFVGLVALILLSADGMTARFGLQLLTGNIFTILILIGGFFLIKFFHGNNERIILYSSIFLTTATFFRYNGIVFLPIEIFLVVGFFCFKYLKIRKTKEKNLNNSDQQTILLKQYSKLKKFLKIALFLFGPWLIFFIFFFSFNTYFFDDPFTNYVSETRNLKGNLLSSFLEFDSQRIDSIETYSATFFHDSINNLIKKFSFTSIDLVPKIWMSIFSLSFIGFTLLISLFFKIKRIEIIVFSSFIMGLLLFYSSNYIVQITGVVPRYMISEFPIIFSLIGFIMYTGWKINFKKISLNYFKVISKNWKFLLIIVFSAILISSLDISPVNQLIIKHNFDFIDPINSSNRYPLDREGLTDESIIVESRGRNVVEYNAIPFNPFKGYSDRTDSWRDNEINQRPITIMKELLYDREDLYVFKYKTLGDPHYFKYLEEQHGIILKEFSNSFCKMMLVEDNEDFLNKKIQSDSICHSHRDLS